LLAPAIVAYEAFPDVALFASADVYLLFYAVSGYYPGYSPPFSSRFPPRD